MLGRKAATGQPGADGSLSCGPWDRQCWGNVFRKCRKIDGRREIIGQIMGSMATPPICLSGAEYCALLSANPSLLQDFVASGPIN